MNHLTPGPRTAALLAAGLALLGSLVVAQPAQASGQRTEAAPVCTADNLYVVKGRLEGAAGSRFLTVRLTNVGDDKCSAGTATKAGFRDFAGPLGVKGALSVGSGAVSLAPGETAKTVIHWTDPGPVPADDCMEAAATLVTLRVPSLKHTWRLPLKAQVCTTAELRPDSEPLAT
jgi:Protein of unknown function (DUF4232)